jgi:hypothetical protein
MHEKELPQTASSQSHSTYAMEVHHRPPCRQIIAIKHLEERRRSALGNIRIGQGSEALPWLFNQEGCRR